MSTEQYGVPQARHRVIVVGIRDDLMQSAPSSLPIDESSPVSVRGVLQGLPRLRSGLSRTQDSDGAAWLAFVQSATSQRWFRTLQRDQPSVAEAVAGAASRVSVPRRGRGKAFLEGHFAPASHTNWFLDRRLEGVCNHESRTHLASDLHRYLFAASVAGCAGRSPTLKDFPTELLPDHQNVETAIAGGGLFSDRFRVQLWDRPSTTVTSHISKEGMSRPLLKCGGGSIPSTR